METTEIDEPQPPEEPTGLLLQDDAQYYLHETGKWARFLGITGFILSCLIALIGIFAGTLFSILGNSSRHYPAGMGIGMGFMYVLMGAFHFWISLYLYRFGTRIKSAIEYKNTMQVSDALSNLKTFFKIISILVIITLAIYALVIIIFISILSARHGI